MKEIAHLDNVSPSYTIKVRQKPKTNGGTKTSSSPGKATKEFSTKTAATRPSLPVLQLPWPPVGQRCWQRSANGKVVLSYSTTDGGDKGTDISTTCGIPIYTASVGKVVYIDNQLQSYGNLIMIKHSKNYITAYARNDTMLVNNDQSVEAGQKIATMGSPSVNTMRLHSQIRYRMIAIDPLRYLPPQGDKPKC